MAGSKIVQDSFGKTKDGEEVTRYTFSNENNVTFQVIDYGGIVTTIEVPDKNGKVEDITLGFETLAEYEGKHPYFGALVGRVANRIANGQFKLDGVTYDLVVNNGPNHLHGGTKGFSMVVWKSEIEDGKLKLTYVSADGEESYPGEVSVTVTYELNSDNEMVIDYTAVSTKPTPINLTNHAYFNLAGQGTKDVYDHEVQIFADKFTRKNDAGIPTGEIASVEGSVFDLRQPVRLGERINDVPGDLGYDHNFCCGDGTEKKLVARVTHKPSGRVLETYTDQPGVQLYTGNYLSGIKGKGGATYGKHSALCLETQNYPDAINQPSFPNCVLRPGETYRHRTWYKFTTAN